jgi:hypothetical protein
MKKIITSVVLVSLVTFYLPACKKSDKKQTTIEKVQGKWQLVTDISNEHVSGMDHINTTTGSPGDILDFRTDGKVYSNIGGQADTSAYALSGDTKLIINGIQLFDITTLTSNSFILYAKETNGGSDFNEETITLKK